MSVWSESGDLSPEAKVAAEFSKITEAVVGGQSIDTEDPSAMYGYVGDDEVIADEPVIETESEAVVDEVVPEVAVADPVVAVEEPTIVLPSEDDEVLQPDGTKKTWKQINNERLMHSDYTKKTTEASNMMRVAEMERSKLAEEYVALQNKMKAFEEDAGYLNQINELRKSGPEAREELAAFLESQGKTEAAAEVRKDPILLEMQKRLATIETEKAALEGKARTEKIWADFKSKFTELQSKYPYADYNEVKASVVAGDYDLLEDATRYSHDKVQKILTDNKVTQIKQEAKVVEIAPPAPTKSKTSAIKPGEVGEEKFTGSIFDADWNQKMSKKIRSVKSIVGV